MSYIDNYKTKLRKRDSLTIFFTILLVLVLPLIVIVVSIQTRLGIGAATVGFVEPEAATLTGNAVVGTDTGTMGESYVQFGSLPGGGSFQPAAPYYATFYYMWYKNQVTDGSWSYWDDHGNVPPNTWFAHYLPDSNPAAFDPVSELYSANDYNNFKWQVAKMAEAKQEVSIASWWGPGTKEDTAFNNIINSFMPRVDNPYPNLRWTVYYEDEGFSDPSVATLVADLIHIKNTFSQSPYFFAINGKPVLFVYAGANDVPGSMTQRWKDANAQMGNMFFVVLKVFPAFASDANQPDSWHQYAPAGRYDAQGPYAFVSPGFWLDDGVSAERLPRNATEFENAVKNMVAANGIWKLTETWNEWGEGTSVEPGEQTTKDGSGKEILKADGYPFKNLYIDILNRNLPALEQGTGR